MADNLTQKQIQAINLNTFLSNPLVGQLMVRVKGGVNNEKK
jgi:hypothetical protein